MIKPLEDESQTSLLLRLLLTANLEWMATAKAARFHDDHLRSQEFLQDVNAYMSSQGLKELIHTGGLPIEFLSNEVIFEQL